MKRVALRRPFLIGLLLPIFILVILPSLLNDNSKHKGPKPKEIDEMIEEHEEIVQEGKNPSLAVVRFSKGILDRMKKNDSRLIKNKENIKYLLTPGSRSCDQLRHNLTFPNFIILVKSDPNNLHLRQFLRASFERYNHFNSSYRLFFLLGYLHNKQKTISNENSVHGDIIQKNFIDQSRNQVFKTKMGFEWVSRNCPKANFVFMLNDDLFINIKNLISFLRQREFSKTVFYGSLVSEVFKIDRNPKSPRYLSKSEYPYSMLIPHFEEGTGIFSWEVAKRITFAFPYVRNVRLEDVYIGLVAYKLGIKLTQSIINLFDFKGCKLMRRKVACRGYTKVGEVFDAWQSSADSWANQAVFIKEERRIQHILMKTRTTLKPSNSSIT